MSPLNKQAHEERLDEVLATFLQARKEGSAPGRAELMDSHPELAEDLATFFADQDRFDQIAAPLRTMKPAPARLRNIRDFGDYEILDEIARGGIGVVFKAWQKSLGRVVALKMLLAGPWASDADLRRFRTEAESAAHLDHRNIVPIYEVGTHDRHPYLSMKFVEGGSLAHRLSTPEGRPSAQEAASLLASIADAVHYAHQRGILHRDLKPANILLQKTATTNNTNNTNKNTKENPIQHKEQKRRADGSTSSNSYSCDSWCHLSPMIADFGLAKRAPRLGWGEGQTSSGSVSSAPTLPQPQALTNTGAIVGTPGYMAPEQASGLANAVTTAADVYGLGAILYEMLTGHPPFQGGTPLDTLRQVLEQEPVRPSMHHRGVDRDLETICLKCLQKEPTRRYASAGELADDLRRFLKGEPILARPVGPLARAWRRARRQPVASSLALALVLAFSVAVPLITLLWRCAKESARHVDHQRLLAEEERDNARTAWNEAERHRREAERHLEDSERSFRLAHQAVNDFCQRVSGELRDVPRLQPLRQSLLKSALTYYDTFLRQHGDNPALRRELADTYLSVATVNDAIGSKADGRAAREKALAIYRHLQGGDPDNLELQRKLGGILNDTAALQDRTEDTLAHLEEARGLYQCYLERHPDNWDLRAGLALTYSNLGWACQQRGRLEQARTAYRQAQDVQEKLLKEKPKNRFMQSSLASTLSNHASMRGRQFGGTTEAVALLERACRLREGLARTAQANANAQADLAACQQNLCTALRDAHRQTEAYEVCKQAFTIRQRLAREHPLVLRYQAELAASHRLLGFFDRAANRLEAALDHHEKARDLQEKLHRLDPGSPGMRRELSWSLFNVAAIHGMLNHRPQEQQSYQRAARTARGASPARSRQSGIPRRPGANAQ